ncbi:MAG: hypothetical protein EPN25_02490 [Nitrospirae bacterium]|nr:MAG: hypothetical protein EPN25_02490 [Nitrospirota bacterium]
MLKNRFPASSNISRLAGSIMLLLVFVALPAISSGSTVADCFKTVAGYNAFTTGASDVIAGVTFAVEHPNCAAMLFDTSFEILSVATIAVKEAGLFTSEGQCQYIVTGGAVAGPVKKAIADTLKKYLPSELSGPLQSYGDDQFQQALNSIPGFEQLPCACSVAFSGLSIANLRAVISKEVKGIKACNSLLSGAVSSMKEGVEKLGEAAGFACEQPKMKEQEYYQTFLAPLLDTYALATDKERHVGCYNHPTGKCRADCMKYYTSGSPGCRMKEGNASHLCDVIFEQFDPKVMARQPVLVSAALAACTGMGDGCVMNKDYPKMVLDTYGQDTLSSCLGLLKNTYKTPGCIPAEQPCCWRAPWPPELKCKKARAEAASRVGNLGSQIEQSFNDLSASNADAKMIADRQACQQAIIGNTLKYVQDAACDAAAKTPTDDYSGIWPAVLQAAKGTASGDAYTKCDGPYNKQVKINGCKSKCANAATLQALYGSSGPSASNQCYSDCMTGAIVGKMKDPGHQQMQSQQQANCIAQCKITCENAPTSVACVNCKKPNACSSGTGSGSGGSAKPKVGSGGAPLQ